MTLLEFSFISSQWVLENVGGLVKDLGVWGDTSIRSLWASSPVKASSARTLGASDCGRDPSCGAGALG